MTELTDYTHRYLAAMRIRDLAVARYPHVPVKPVHDLDSLAVQISDEELRDISECSNTEVKKMITLCLMEDTYPTPRVHRRSEGVVDKVVKEVFA